MYIADAPFIIAIYSYFKPFYKHMNSIEEVKDCVIADEIMRIQVLTKEDLIRELIDVRSRQIETMKPDEFMAYLKTRNHGNED